MSTKPNGVWPIVKNVLSTLGGLVVLVLFLAWMGGAFKSKVKPDDSAPARQKAEGRESYVLGYSDVDESLVVVGAVQPRRKTDVASRIISAVLEVKVQPGQKVEPKQELVVLDDRELVAQQREALASVAVAEADADVRKREFDRVMRLPENSTTKEERDRVTGSYNVAQAQLQRTREQVSRIEVLITYTRIKATTSGIVTGRFVDPGDLAAPGKPLLAIQDASELELHVAVPESQAPRISIGQKLDLQIASANLKGVGTVREIVPVAEQASRSVLIKVSLPTVGSAPLFAGMFGRVTIPTGQSRRLLVPAAAIRNVGQLETVEVITDDGFLERRFVRIGRRFPVKNDDHLEILSGLKQGDRIALN